MPLATRKSDTARTETRRPRERESGWCVITSDLRHGWTCIGVRACSPFDAERRDVFRGIRLPPLKYRVADFEGVDDRGDAESSEKKSRFVQSVTYGERG